MQTHVERFLAPFKDLRQWELITIQCGEEKLVDANQWERFILKYLPRLSTFNFKLSSYQMNRNIINKYRRPFWLDGHWYVLCNPNMRLFFTVPHFVPTSIFHSCDLQLSDCTTLLIEQHFIFYDSVNELKLDSNQCELPYRYNHVKALILDDVFMHENILDLSKIQSLIVKTSEWSFNKIIKFIKELMSSVNYLNLHCIYPKKDYPIISLEQIRILCLPQYGKSEDKDKFNWSQLFLLIEQLILSINSKSQIKFLIYQFKIMLSGFFALDIHIIWMKKSK